MFTACLVVIGDTLTKPASNELCKEFCNAIFHVLEKHSRVYFFYSMVKSLIGRLVN